MSKLRQSAPDLPAEGLRRLAGRPDAEAWLERVRRRRAAEGARPSAEEILGFRDADRR